MVPETHSLGNQKHATGEVWGDQQAPARSSEFWSRASQRPQAILILLTLLVLLPFINKAVHIDDPIFIWTAQQITRHPFDPYGFTALWWWHPTYMWQIQQNPPLAAYYMALIGSVAGWSERVLHIGFMLPALGVVLGTYHLARHFTQRPFIAAAATLLAPGFLVSATGLMCDVMMLALWLLAVVFWLEGLEDSTKPFYLAISGVLIAACTLTKYFGISLIPLLFVYALWRRRSFRSWIGYFIIPVAILAAYELYTLELYGHGLIEQAMQHTSEIRKLEGRSGRALVGLAFLGGCSLPALIFAPLLWSRKQVLFGGLLSIFLAFCFFMGWVDLGTIYQGQRWLLYHKLFISTQLIFFVASALSVLALAVADFWKRRGPDSILLLLWILGTMFFATVVNWTVNARSLLPMIPAVAILLAIRLDQRQLTFTGRRWITVAVPLLLSGAISLWAAAGDAAVANTARMAANYIHEKTRNDSGTVWFEGRWGFEYYMDKFGAQPLEPNIYKHKSGDLIVVPLYNTQEFLFPMNLTAKQSADYDVHSWMATMNPDAGAGFYFSGWGPLPFVFGPVPRQRYFMARVVQEKQ